MLKRFLIYYFISQYFLISGIVYGIGPGTSGASILTYPIGARAIGMAEAYTSVEGDVLGIHYNPAALSLTDKRHGLISYRTGIADDNFGIIGACSPTKFGTVAGSLIYYSAGKIELINVTGDAWTSNAQTDYILTLSLSRNIKNIKENISWGINIKMINSTLLEKFNSSTFAFDLGALYRIIDQKLTVGISLLNSGIGMKYLEVSDPLPISMRTGLAYSFDIKKQKKLLTTLDLVLTNNEDTKINVGAEYPFNKVFTLRAGYKMGYDLDSISIGFGFKRDKFKIDYATVIMGDFGLSHVLSLSTNF